MIRRLIPIVLLLLAGLPAAAQQLAYIYIQGDKQTPFYVKLEGAMQERYGKNYCILPQMAPGPAHLEILFQQNVFPPQQFTIQVPEGGSRGFLLTRQNGAFSLYDLQQQFYIPAGNAESDDHLPAEGIAAAPPVAAAPPAEEETADTIPVATVARTPPAERKRKNRNTGAQRPAATPAAAGSGDPRFLQDIELGHPERTGQAAPLPTGSAPADPGARPSLSGSFRNSDCPEAMDNAAFEKVYKTMMEQNTDEDRIAYLDGQMDKCYKSWHARTLGNLLTEDAARYSFLKRVYPRITDQQAFPLLDDILRSEVWKAQFQQLIHR